MSAQAHRLYHLGSTKLSRSNLSRINEDKPAALYEALFGKLLKRCQTVAPGHKFHFKNALYSLDASTINLCLSMFPWADFRTTKGAIKLHVGLNHAGFIPWSGLEKKIRRHYPKRGNGHPPYLLAITLRIHCVQLFYNLSDPAMEDMLYEIESVRRFVGLRLSEALPDETTILNFRYLLERKNLGEKIFASINKYLDDKELMLRKGTIVDVSIIAAPTSTKNKSGKRDEEMHQTKKGNEWHFGMKVHIGVDDELGIFHSVATGPANEHDITRASDLLHGQESRVYCDAGYLGIEKRPEHKSRDVTWNIAMRPGKRKELQPNSRAAKREKKRASVRVKVEHVFSYVKRMFGYDKVRYKGISKNTNRLAMLLSFTNLLITDRYVVT